jgi:hypothetical protein
MAIRAKYKSKTAEFYNDIPARDLEDEDWDALTAEQKEQVRKGDLYEYIPQQRTSSEGSN